MHTIDQRVEERPATCASICAHGSDVRGDLDDASEHLQCGDLRDLSQHGEINRFGLLVSVFSSL